MSARPVGVGVIGAGTISREYLTNLTSFPDVEVRAIGDLDADAARARAEEFGVPAHGTTADVLADETVEIVVNLTVPAAHGPVAEQALSAGKHVWNEKPITMDRASARALVDQAAEQGLRIGAAPDTVLGAGVQSALRLLHEGRAGRVQSATAIFQSPGPESWHPSPEFLFSPGGGPLFDMGPYYLTTLALIFGPIRRVAAVAARAHERRTIGSGPRAGHVFDVTVMTQVSTLLQFESGANATLLMSFDSPHARVGFVEVSGVEATIAFPDPNQFDGEARVCANRSQEWESVPCTGAPAGRGLGVLDMARAIRAGRPHRLQGDLAYHVLDAMVAIDEAGRTGELREVTSTFETRPPVPSDWDPRASTLG